MEIVHLVCAGSQQSEKILIDGKPYYILALFYYNGILSLHLNVTYFYPELYGLKICCMSDCVLW